MNTNVEISVGEILERLVSELAYHKKAITVEENRLGSTMSSVDIQVHKGDYPRVVGGKGVHIIAIQRLCELIGHRRGQKIKVNMLESVTGEKDRLPDFVVKQDWRKDEVETLAKDIANSIFEHDCAATAYDTKSGDTNLEIYVSPMEAEQLLVAVSALLKPLFKAIGMNNGRRLELNIVRE